MTVAISSETRIYWLDANTFSATQAGAGPYTATVTGADVTAYFPVGSVFSTTGGGGGKVVSAVAFTGGNTIITTANALSGGAATLTQSYNWLAYTWAKLSVAWNKPQYMIGDRLGLQHRIMPASASAKLRYALSLQVKLLGNDILATAVDGLSLPEVLDTWVMDADTEFIILHGEDQVNNDGGAVSIKRAYKCKLDELPPDLLGTLSSINGEDISAVLPFTCHSDGAFSNINNPAGASYRTRPT